MPKTCGKPVHSMWAELVQTERVLRSLHAPAQAWAQTVHITPMLSKFCTHLSTPIVDSFTAVNAQLSALCTAPITTTTIK